MYYLTFEDKFDAAHWLDGYNGACANLHGHTWKVELALLADRTRELGIIIDFKDIKRAFKRVLSEFDHDCLNRKLPVGVNPTAENIAKYLFWRFKQVFAEAEKEDIAYVHTVTVWESDHASCVFCYAPGDTFDEFLPKDVPDEKPLEEIVGAEDSDSHSDTNKE